MQMAVTCITSVLKIQALYGACLLCVNATLPAVDNDVVQLKIIQPCCIKAQMQVHEAPVQGRVLQQHMPLVDI